MCGRFAITGDVDFYADYFGVSETTESLEPNWNTAPTDPAYVVAEHDEQRLMGKMGWGIVPPSSKDGKAIQINARAETVATRGLFKRAFSLHRCIIPADGFYEWEPKEVGRTPHWIHRADGYPMSFAGIWAAWRPNEDTPWQRRFAIITTEAEGVIADIHNRMPVILPEDVWEPWLDRTLTDPHEAEALIRNIDPDLIMEHTVSSAVNSVRNNGPELVKPAK